MEKESSPVASLLSGYLRLVNLRSRKQNSGVNDTSRHMAIDFSIHVKANLGTMELCRK